jgi:cell division septal protein FtsQ
MKAYVRLFALLIFTSTLAGGLYLGAEHGWGRLASVQVIMDSSSDQNQIFARMEPALAKTLSQFSGRWLWQVPLGEVLRQVETDKRVRSAKVTRVFPNRLEVSVIPHQPAIAWVDEVGRFFPVATDATLLPAIPSHEATDVPILRGRAFKSDQALREKALTLLTELPAAGFLSKRRVAEIMYNERDGFSLLLTQGGMEVRLGEGQVGLKASRAERVLNYLEDQQLRGRVVDARFAKKVVVRLRNDP